ncbi:hypothetical protein GQX74_001097 [Glossina fuscipes]|nr:hypothetical protein GQX74_001097 [Glossina fuscipes]
MLGATNTAVFVVFIANVVDMANKLDRTYVLRPTSKNDLTMAFNLKDIQATTNTDYTAFTALNERKTGGVQKKTSEKVTDTEGKRLLKSGHKNGERKRISADNKDSTIFNNSKKGEERKLIGRAIFIGSTKSSTSKHSKKAEGKNILRKTNNIINNLSLLSSNDYKNEKRKRVLEKIATAARKGFPTSSESKKTLADKATTIDRKDYLAPSGSKRTSGKTKMLSDKATTVTSSESRRSSSSSDFKDIATSNDSIYPSNANVGRQLTNTKENSTESFLLAFAPVIEGLSTNQKWRARVKIAKIIHEMETEQG